MYSKIVIAASLFAMPTLAEDAHREADAHMHGVSELKIAIDDHNLAMDLSAPGMDIAGFEYAPESDEDHAAVEAAILQLGNPTSLFTMNEEAECHVTQIFAEHQGAHDDHESEETHSAYHAKYAFDCENIDALTSLEFPYFDQFENAQEIEIELVSDNGATQIEVTRDNPVALIN